MGALGSLVAACLVAGLFLFGGCGAKPPAPMLSDGGACSCPAGFKCSDDGMQCLTCTPSCSGRQCGDDGCGGSCGGCGMYEACNAGGACQKTCDLPPIQAATTLNLDLKVYAVTGTLTLNGGAIPDDTTGRGDLVFRDKKSGNVFTVAIGSTGAATINTKLFGGTYTVSFDSTGSQRVLPRQTVVVADDFVIDRDRTLAADLKVVSVSGGVTLNGRVLPDDRNDRGGVRWRRVDSGSVFYVSVGTMGAGAYTAQLYSGTYDVIFDSTGSQTVLPRQTVTLFPGRQLTADTKLDLDLKTANLGGEITRGGATLPTSTQDRGSVILTRSDDGGRVAMSVGTTGAGHFAGTLYVGTYDLSFDSTGSQTVLPRQIVPLASAVSLTADKIANYDVQVVTVTGTATLNGGAIPDDTTSRGALVFARADNRSSVQVALPSTGAATYSVTMYAGSYNVSIDSTGSQKVLPRMAMTVQRGVALSADKRVDVALATARLSGTVTVDGGAIPDDTTSRGQIIFIERSGGSRISASLSSTGAATYNLTVYQAGYGVQFDSTGSQKVLPRLSTSLPQLNVTADATVNLPLTTIDVTGTVTLNGQALPAEPSGKSRGSVLLLNKLTGSRVSLDMMASGDGRIATKVYAGSYNVMYDATGTQALLPHQQVLLLSGCVAPDPGCTRSKDDLTGAWTLTYLDTSWGVMSLDVHQSGSTITGYSDVWWGSGPIQNGRRQGDTIHMVVGGSINADSDGQVVTGCFMTGSAHANTGPSSDWIAERVQ